MTEVNARGVTGVIVTTKLTHLHFLASFQHPPRRALKSLRLSVPQCGREEGNERTISSKVGETGGDVG